MDKGLLNEATSPDDTPTPGYMYTEISRLTVANYQACIQLIEFLNARLKKNNHNVKFKCLMIIKQVCRTGRADFKKEMARNLDAVKECLQYKGPPDPLRGDEIYKRVRDAAKEALDAIFDSQMPQTTSSVSSRIQGIGGGEAQPVHASTPNTSSGFSFFRSDSSEASYVATEGEMASGGRMTGFGSSSSNATSGSSSYPNSNSANNSGTGSGGNGMTGIGNPNFRDPRNEVSWTQKMAAFAEGALASTSSTSSTSSPSYPPGSNNSDYQMRSNRDSPFGEAHKTPSYLPSSGPWGGSHSHSVSPSPASPLPTSGGIVPDIPSIAGGLGRAGHAAADGAYEQSLVAALCEAGGMKASPPDDKLEDFLSAAPTLSPEFIGSSLIGFINSDSWQSRAKALVVVGALVKRSGCSQHSEWWTVNGAEDIQILAQTDSKATVKTQAIKTLRSLGISTSSIASTSSPASSQQRHSTPSSVQGQVQGQAQVAKATSLLDFENDDISTPSAPAVVSAPVVPQQEIHREVVSVGGGDGLFDGLSVGSPNPVSPSGPPPQAPQVPQTPPQQNQQQQQQQAPPPVPQSTNLLDFLEPTPAAPSASNPKPSIDLNSLYGPSVVSEPPPQATLPSLAGLNLSVPVRMPQNPHQHPPQHYPQQGYPQQGYPPHGYPPQQMYPPQGYQQPPQLLYTPMVPSAMGQNNPQLGARKVIPDATSGFSFLESNGAKKNPDDAFSFVKDAMTKK